MAGRPASTDSAVAFVDRALQLREAEAEDPGDLRFHPRLFCQLALPYRDPGPNLAVWERRNGPFTLTVRPAVETASDGTRRIGYPFGSIPRLLLTWMASEVAQQPKDKPERQLVLGENLSDFMRQIGLVPTGGKTGTIPRLRRQINRLFDSVISAQFHGDPYRDVGYNFTIASYKDLWWSDNDRDARQGSLMPSVVNLSEEFFQELRKHPVPVHLGAVRLLQSRPMAFDIYTWLTHRMFFLRQRQHITWAQMRMQFGNNTADTRQGRAKFRELFATNLRYVTEVYPEARISISAEGVVLLPSPPHVAPRKALP